MRHILLSVTAVAGLLAFGASLGTAQDRDDWYRNRDTFFHDQTWKAHLFDRVRDDLNRVQSDSFSGGGDQYRIARTKEELGELQGKLVENRYDQPELDNVIAGLQRVIDSNRLTSRDRDVLTNDITRLRDYRAHHENWR